MLRVEGSKLKGEDGSMFFFFFGGVGEWKAEHCLLGDS